MKTSGVKYNILYTVITKIYLKYNNKKEKAQNKMYKT